MHNGATRSVGLPLPFWGEGGGEGVTGPSKSATSPSRRPLAHAVDQRCTQQIGAVGGGIGSGLAQRLVALRAQRRVLLLQPLLVGDGLLLHVLDIERPAEAVVLLEDRRRPL